MRNFVLREQDGRFLPAIISITFNSLRMPIAIVLSAMGLEIVGVCVGNQYLSMLKSFPLSGSGLYKKDIEVRSLF